MVLGVAVGCRAVNVEANAVIGFSKILEKVKGRAALPRLKIDLLSAANHYFFHARMLNRTNTLSDSKPDEGAISDTEPSVCLNRRLSKTLYQGHLFQGMSRLASVAFVPRESLILGWVVRQPETSNHILQLFRVAGQ